jgi:hypothetical protein
VFNWIAFGDAACFEKSVPATRRYSGASMRNVDPYGALFRGYQAGLIRPIEDDAEWETWTDPPSARNWPHCYFWRDDVLSIWPARSRSVTEDSRAYFGFFDLATSWAEATGEAWPIILYRLCDWAITDAFPDDAFVTSHDHSVIFHKNTIFRRGNWHAEIQRKLLREQDDRSRARLQNFADRHLDVLRAALLGRDAVLAACRVMNVRPPPICGSLTAAPAMHCLPPEPPSDAVVGVFAREEEQDRERRRGIIGKVMPPDEVEKYIMLWDAAGAMCRDNGEALERNWLRLMDAFWCGHLSPDGLVHFYRAGTAEREFILQDREVLAGLLLGWRTVGHGTREPTQPIQNLRHWTVADYVQQPAPFDDYFKRDTEGRFGLAVLSSEFDRWRQGVARAGDRKRPDAAQREKTTHRRPRRGMYIGTLALFMSRYLDERLERLSDQDISREFERHCEELLVAGKASPNLPKDRRNIENQVAKIRDRRLTKRTEPAHPRNV